MMTVSADDGEFVRLSKPPKSVGDKAKVNPKVGVLEYDIIEDFESHATYSKGSTRFPAMTNV